MDRKHGEWLRAKGKQIKTELVGRFKFDYYKDKVELKDMNEEIDKHKWDSINFLVQHSNHTAAFLQSINIIEFYAYMRRVEQQLLSK